MNCVSSTASGKTLMMREPLTWQSDYVFDEGSLLGTVEQDTTIQNDLAKTAACFDALAADPSYGALVFPQVLYSARTIDRYRMFSEVHARHGKPILLPLVGGWIGGPGYVEAEASPYTSPFLSIDRCFATLAAWFWRARMARSTSARFRHSGFSQKMCLPAAATATIWSACIE